MGVVIIDAAAAKSGFAAGASARGEFQCAECGYGIVVHRDLPACPMCHGADWYPWSRRRSVQLELSTPSPAAGLALKRRSPPADDWTVASPRRQHLLLDLSRALHATLDPTEVARRFERPLRAADRRPRAHLAARGRLRPPGRAGCSHRAESREPGPDCTPCARDVPSAAGRSRLPGADSVPRRGDRVDRGDGRIARRPRIGRYAPLARAGRAGRGGRRKRAGPRAGARGVQAVPGPGRADARRHVRRSRRQRPAGVREPPARGADRRRGRGVAHRRGRLV